MYKSKSVKKQTLNKINVRLNYIRSLNKIKINYEEQTNQLKQSELRSVALENGFNSSDVEEVSKLS